MPHTTNPFKIISNHFKTGNKTSIQPIGLFCAFPAFESKQVKKSNGGSGKNLHILKTNTSKLPQASHKSTSTQSIASSLSVIVANDRLLSIIIDYSSIFDLIEWRCICRQFRRIIDHRLVCITHLSITKDNWMTAIIENDHNDDSRKSKAIYNHNSSGHLSSSLDGNRLCVKIDHNWTINDANQIWQLINRCRHHILSAKFDCSILEFIISKINSREIKRLYSMLCEIDETRDNGNEYRTLSSSQKISASKSAKLKHKKTQPLFANLRQLTIRSSIISIRHLTRLVSYDVDVDLLYSRLTIELVTVQIIGNFIGRERLKKHIADFRRWANTIELGDRYIQQFRKPKQLSTSHHSIYLKTQQSSADAESNRQLMLSKLSKIE